MNNAIGNAILPQAQKSVAIIGAGASGLMAADALSAYAHQGLQISVFEQMPSAARKILMAGKTGLNLSNNKPLADFNAAYYPSDWVGQYVAKYHTPWLIAWLDMLGIETFVGSTGRIFPKSMKAAPLVRRWLARLQANGVALFYRKRCVGIHGNQVAFVPSHTPLAQPSYQCFDAIILACGGGSYARLGSDGAWQAWFDNDEITPFYASNVGVVYPWSPYMSKFFGQPLKRVRLWTNANGKHHEALGDVVISHYGLESGTVYQLNHAIRQQLNNSGYAMLHIDLSPDVSYDTLLSKLNSYQKQSLPNRLRKLGLDKAKIALVQECCDKAKWSDMSAVAHQIKHCTLRIASLRPIDEAISTGGGVKRGAVADNLQLLSNPYVFVAGEMLDWDAPTGGYLLSACFAMGQTVGMEVASYLGYR